MVLGDFTAASPFRDLMSTTIYSFHDKILIRETGEDMNGFHSCSTRVYYILRTSYSFLKFYFSFKREKERTWVGNEQRQKETQNPKQAPCCQSKAQRGAWTHELWDHDPNWSQMPNWLSHPEAPRISYSLRSSFKGQQSSTKNPGF